LPVDRERAVEGFSFCHVSAAAFLVQEPLHSHLTLHKAGAGLSGDLNGESYGWKLFHREECPALERNIIDTSERACASYRYVSGQHFGLLKRYTRGHSELATKNLSIRVSSELSARSARRMPNESGTVTERRVTPSFGEVLIFALNEATSAALSAISGLPALPVTPCRCVDDTVSACSIRLFFTPNCLP
jgi:hypothetical protein